ncbi:hypothetical protein KAR91_21200 [Candidatus Pacearchaeota archaeon]|nr:hypothetical protein [Candidatus Pacearchaeota archaeon]
MSTGLIYAAAITGGCLAIILALIVAVVSKMQKLEDVDEVGKRKAPK